MRSINLIVIHCAATPNGKPFTVADIDAWHYQRGFRRALAFRQRQEMNLAAIGYHWVIYTNGAVANGRHLDEIGAHVAGHNESSIGICLIGTDKFTFAQWASLRDNLCATARTIAEARGLHTQSFGRPAPAEATALYRQMHVRVLGHRDLPDVHKECPGFDVAAFLARGMLPLTEQILEE
ncbi:MAG TPA: N-acetylmuramoyl-L-alanine amidase [Acidiferrobacterales bacterium]|nr:N-acetylmuramoyl-L-alanine amidase [Acidiferrobacterales bacterium]